METKISKLFEEKPSEVRSLPHVKINELLPQFNSGKENYSMTQKIKMYAGLPLVLS